VDASIFHNKSTAQRRSPRMHYPQKGAAKQSNQVIDLMQSDDDSVRVLSVRTCYMIEFVKVTS